MFYLREIRALAAFVSTVMILPYGPTPPARQVIQFSAWRLCEYGAREDGGGKRDPRRRVAPGDRGGARRSPRGTRAHSLQSAFHQQSAIPKTSAPRGGTHPGSFTGHRGLSSTSHGGGDIFS